MVERTRLFAAGIVAIGLGIAMASPSAAAENDRNRLVDRIVAKADPKVMEVLVTRRDANGRPAFETIKVPSLERAKEVVGGLLGKPGVHGVEMNRRVTALINDPYYPLQWGLTSTYLDYSGVAKATKNDTSRPYVAVVDSGVQGNHPDLATSMSGGYDATTGQTTSASTDNDTCDHGTHVAGIIAAEVNNDEGVVGLGQRVRIRAVRVLKRTLLGGCEGDTNDVADGIVWAADHADVINMSLGADSASDAEKAAVEYARGRNRVIVAAAGNCDPTCSTPSYPAGYRGVLGVGAYGQDGAVASFSSKGSQVDVIAPGVHIASTVPDGYAYMDGTSMATPFVAAEAALAKQHCGWTGDKARIAIMRTAGHPDWRSNSSGYGKIHPTRLLRC
jgi:subtilisin family serine protease